MLEISVNMILDTLAVYEPECFCPAENIYFSGLRLYERGQAELSPENIYMCTSRNLDVPALESNCYFICVNRLTPTLLNRCAGKRVAVIQNESVTLSDVFNTIQQLFTDLREWHQDMHVSLIKNNDVQELLNLSERAIGNPIVLVDMGFRLLAHTEHIETDDEVYNELVRHGYHTRQNIDRLTHDRQVESIKNISAIDVEFPLPQVTRYQTMTKTFYMDGIPYAYLRMICSSKPASRSLEERFALLSDSVELYMHSRYSTENINKNIYEYVLVELIERRIADRNSQRARLETAGLDMDAEYQLAKIVFDDEENVSLSYMLEQLLAIIPESRPFIYNNCIIMLMSYESYNRTTQERKGLHFQALRDFLTHYHAWCGLSAVFRSPLLVGDAYVQAEVSISLGQKLSTHDSQASQHMFAYQDCFVYHLIIACAKETQLESLCDEAVLEIWARDRQKNTKSSELLRTYLANKCRPTQTGNLLHMHRNNVIYHVERLTERYNLDLEDPDTCLRLQISFKVLDLLCKLSDGKYPDENVLGSTSAEDFNRKR